MTRRKKPLHRPTDAQLAILNVLWRMGPATVRQVHEDLPLASRRRYTTTLKLMQVMAERGLVKRDESARSHIYEASFDEQEMKDELVGDLMEKAFEGSAGRLALRALSHKRASPEELEQVRRLLDQLEGEKEGPG